MEIKPFKEEDSDDPLNFELMDYPRLQADANVLCYIAKANGHEAAISNHSWLRRQLTEPVTQLVRDGVLGDVVLTISNIESYPFIKRRRLIAK